MIYFCFLVEIRPAVSISQCAFCVLCSLILRWSTIATHLPKRTDNEIKNYWNTHLKKRLAKLGIDPVTHKPKTDGFILSNNSQSKRNTNLRHMAQWESARLEAEARFVRQSKFCSNLPNERLGSQAPTFSPVASATLINVVAPFKPSRCFDVLKDLKAVWNKPRSKISFSGNAPGFPTTAIGERFDCLS